MRAEQEKTMIKRTLSTSALLTSVILLLSGCTDKKTIIVYDNLEPSAPRGVNSYTGDGYVLLTWFSNPEPDLAGYDIYRGTTDCNGPYTYLASTTDTSFVDYNVSNGNTYYYAIAAYDIDNLQSNLSYDCIHDTPRPEGVVTLYDFNTFPNDAGFDFSAETRVPWNSANSDIYFELYVPTQTFYINANAGTDIQDFGYADTLADVGFAPDQGWSELGYAEAILGHVYILKIWDSSFIHYNYAKVRVNALGANYARLEWAYQVAQDNGELRPVVQNSTKN